MLCIVDERHLVPKESIQKETFIGKVMLQRKSQGVEEVKQMLEQVGIPNRRNPTCKGTGAGGTGRQRAPKEGPVSRAGKSMGSHHIRWTGMRPDHAPGIESKAVLIQLFLMGTSIMFQCTKHRRHPEAIRVQRDYGFLNELKHKSIVAN